MKRIVLVSGSSNPKLASRISQFLDVSLVDPQLVRFANGEIYCEIEKNVRGADVFVIQSTSSPVNDHVMELLIMIDALKRASAASITAVIPHYGYSRQDRKASPRTPISAKLIADILTAAGATRVITMDLHASQIQGFFNIPFDNIYASPVLLEYIRAEIFNDNSIFVSPDAGGVERVRHYAKKLKADIAMIDKRRTGKNVAKAMNIVGNVEGKECIIIDDMVDTAGTLIEACRALKDNGATKVYACATHPVFSNPALERIAGAEELDRIIVTDTIPLSPEGELIDKIHVLDTAEILAKAIHRTFNNDSVSSLFL
ncbi:phosphoribosylpyrophosphate synthetase [Halobacteriovorax marinus]|uniref:Ribose-phosphate pyrophosphokinase n=1 Tax=Halobacteriovorax marinus (strain ATCC BAA-682 / DSM 15412 / SJ) TaxID=862908 RepID=E1X180_HALMS|nr:ribose-phosphate pyrophosphokinase [Halobacteriovorax marinus]ATH09410.1 phosphoribosylpyrophosphate synthetase [Halobacteriovorax marinus]CBW28150.1 ribose-phosphate pyrophosphokinase [Halobacteriovorax marinus SJ]